MLATGGDGSTGVPRSRSVSASPRKRESKEAQTLLSRGIISVVYESLTLLWTDRRSSASRSEMSLACRDTRRSRGGPHVCNEARKSLDDEQTAWAPALDQSSKGAATSRIFVRVRATGVAGTRRSGLAADAGHTRPIESSDVSLPLDAGTERKCDDVENSINRLTRKRCGQVKIRQG